MRKNNKQCNRKIRFANLSVVLNALYNKRNTVVGFSKLIPQLYFFCYALLIRCRKFNKNTFFKHTIFTHFYYKDRVIIRKEEEFMSRKALKNTIMIAVLIVTLGLTGLTIYKASEGAGPKNGKVSERHGMMPKGEMPTDENGQIEKIEKPTDENGQIEKREMPTNENDEVEKPNNMSFGNGRGMKRDGTFLSTTYYILFGMEGVIIGFIIIYLIVTKMNQQGVKQTLKNKKKLTIIMIGTVILAAGIAAGSGAISNSIAMNHVPKRDFNMEEQNGPMGNNPDSNSEQTTTTSM